MAGSGVPSSNGHSASPKRARAAQRRPRTSGPKVPQGTLDEEVVSLRETGKSYTSVAKTLGIARGSEAHAAFLRAFRARPEKERLAMAKRENHRLDLLEKRVRSHDVGQPDTLKRRLAALEKFRQSLV